MNARDEINSELPVKPLRQKYQRLSELVVEELINWIMDGTLRADQRLNADELAEKFGVSRMPVREALKILEKSGLVESTPYLGTKVKMLTKEDIEEIYILREILESTAARYAAERIEPEEIAKLEAIQNEMEEMMKQDSQFNRKKVYLLNREFHTLLYQASRMNRLCEFINTLWDSIAFYRLLSASSQHYKQWMQNEHNSYIEALKKRDGALLAKLISQSLQKHVQIMPWELETYYASIKKENYQP